MIRSKIKDIALPTKFRKVTDNQCPTVPEKDG